VISLRLLQLPDVTGAIEGGVPAYRFLAKTGGGMRLAGVKKLSRAETIVGTFGAEV
jgi:hypothetical protein